MICDVSLVIDEWELFPGYLGLQIDKKLGLNSPIDILRTSIMTMRHKIPKRNDTEK